MDSQIKAKPAEAPQDRVSTPPLERPAQEPAHEPMPAHQPPPAPEPPPAAASGAPRLRVVPFLITLVAVGAAVALSLMMWNAYMVAPWTRDGTVRAYVVTMAPEIVGRIVELPVIDNQHVRKGDLLMVIEPTNYQIAVQLAEAVVEQTKALSQNAQAEAQRRQKLTDLSTSEEVKETFSSNAVAADAAYRQAVANLAQARVNLERTRISSPVNGYVTNLLAQLGDYVTVGESVISLVDSDSFWVDGYFEETNLERIREGDTAQIKLMGYSEVLRGHVDSIARGINVPNAQPNQQGVANVNPIFTWVRLAQRIPVRIHIDEVPDGVVLSAGMTATVQIDPGTRQPPQPAKAPAQGEPAKTSATDEQPQDAPPAGPAKAEPPKAPASPPRANAPPPKKEHSKHPEKDDRNAQK